MSEELVFYGAPQSRAVTVHWMLEELGVPFEMRVIDFKKDEQKQPAYLAVNPMGKVPAIVHRGVAIAEAAAICCYLADAFPEAGLAPAIGDPQRGPYLKWLFFGPSCFEPALVDRMFKRPEENKAALGWGGYEAAVGHVAGAAKAASPWLLGERFTAADVVIGSGVIWALMTGGVAERPEFTAYADRLKARPALQRVFVRDAEQTAKLQE
jgi:glutathione S-transferase